MGGPFAFGVSDFRVDGVFVGPACDGAEEGWTGIVETGEPGEGAHMWESLLAFCWFRIRYRACSSPPRVRRALAPTNGKAATDEIREI